MNTTTSVRRGLQLLIGVSATMIALSQLEETRAQELYEEGRYLEYVFNGGNIQNFDTFRINEHYHELGCGLDSVEMIRQDKFIFTFYTQNSTNYEGFHVNTLESSLHERLVIGGVGVTSLYTMFEHF